MAGSIGVLHVDDDADFAAVTADALEQADDRIQVTRAADAADGLDRLRSESVDCVVSDYDMPGIDGLEFLSQVRDEDPDVPFILFTGKGSEAVASEALSKGATDYLQKGGGRDQFRILANRVANYVETARHRAQRRRQYQAIETATEGIGIMDETGEFVFVNEACGDLYGYDPDELVGETWKLVHPESEHEFVEETVIPTLFEEGEWHGETLGQRADGSTFVEDHTLSRTDNGEFICTIRDVTEARERKRDLERYETIVEAMGEGVYAIDTEGAFIEVNENVEQLVGYDREELATMDPADLFGDEARNAADAAIETLVGSDEQSAKTIETVVERSDGETVPIEATITLLPGDDDECRGIVGVVRDVTERRERERELERYETMLEAVGDGVYALDDDGVVIEVNEAVVEMIGADYEELVDVNVAEYFDDQDLGRFQEAIRTLLGDGDRSVVTVDGPLKCADGSKIPVEVTLTLLPAEDGEFRGTVGVVRDVSERRERERELERYETLLGLMPDTVIVTDMDGIVTEIHGFEGWSGYDHDDLIGEHMSRTMPPEDVERAEEIVADLVQSDDRSKATYEHHTETKDGDRIPFENHITLLSRGDDGRVRGTMSVLRNISDRKARERALQRQNERLEEFAGIVSHDLRNPLNVANARLELARDDCDSDHLDAVARSHDRMAGLIDDLLTLAQESEPVEDREELDLGRLAEEAWRYVDTGAAVLQVDVDEVVYASEGRLKQLLENLLRNAVEHGGAAVTIRIGELQDRPGFYVADDGPGIPPADRERVFESGYTTAQEGTGFGLSIVSEVAEAHGWSVSVTESAAGGARFEVETDGA